MTQNTVLAIEEKVWWKDECCIRWIAIMVFFVALIPRMIAPLATSICYDELATKNSGPMLELLKKGDFQSEEWAEYPYFPFYKYVYGLIPQMILGSDPSDPDDLLGARWMGALLGSGIILVTFLIGIKILPMPAALIGALFLAFVPTVLGHDRIAMHDAPSRLFAFIAWWFILRWNERRSWKDFFWSAILSGLSIVFFHRTGIMSFLAMAIWLAWVLKTTQPLVINRVRTFVLFGLISFSAFLAAVWLFWPYMWSRPTELLRWYLDPLKTASTSTSSEFWFGRIQILPWYYYFVALAISTPPLTFLASLFWQGRSFGRALREPILLALFLLIWVPLLVVTFTYKQILAHYLQIVFPALCLTAGAMVWQIRSWITRKFPEWKMAGWVVVILPLAMELYACASVNPYFMQYFNVFTGGGACVVKNRLFTQATYGEVIHPLFKYLHTHGKPGSTVLCRFGAWPGLGKLNRYVGPSFLLQGHRAIDPLGAYYILRIGIERDNPFYRYEPDPFFYQKVMDVMVDGGSFADVWERRRDFEAHDLLYVDDFASPQITHFIVGLTNVNLNPFSDGKIYTANPQEHSAMAIRIPAVFFKDRSKLRCEVDLQMREGWFHMLAGDDLKSLQPMGEASHFVGKVEGREFIHPTGKDLYIAFEWHSSHPWDGSSINFWNTDWIDALRIFGKSQ